MVRTSLLALLLAAGAAIAGPPAHRLLLVTPHHPGDAPATRYEQRLADAIAARGYRPGRDFRIEGRHVGFDAARFKAIAAEATANPPSVVVCATAACATAFAQATTTIPILFSSYTDPVADGLAESLARPGRNVTGTTSYLAVEGKQMEALKQAFASLASVVILDDEDGPMPPEQLARLNAAATAVGLRPVRCGISSEAKDFAIARCGRLAGDAGIYVPISNRFFKRASELVSAVGRSGRPAIYEFSGYVSAGGLFALEPRRRPVYEDLAYLIDQVLRGTPASVLPIVRPRETRIVVNRKAMESLGQRIHPEVLKRAELLDP